MTIFVTRQYVTHTLRRNIMLTIVKRSMATEKQLFDKMQSTKSIQKITSSMKMVSAAKLKGDENRLNLAKSFNLWTTPLSGEAKELNSSTFEEIPQKTLIVPITSDKGLCGGVNSFISRGTRSCVAKLSAEGKHSDIFVIGDKGRSQMRRIIGDKIIKSATEIGSPGCFTLATALAVEIIAAGLKNYDAIMIIYNSFLNAAVYRQVYKVIRPFVADGNQESMVNYEFEPDTKSEVLIDLHEYLLSSQIYHSFMDAAASEQSSRMTAMENATKNSGEIIDSLNLQYNRARQARITTELIEIISGASAIDN